MYFHVSSALSTLLLTSRTLIQCIQIMLVLRVLDGRIRLKTDNGGLNCSGTMHSYKRRHYKGIYAVITVTSMLKLFIGVSIITAWILQQQIMWSLSPEEDMMVIQIWLWLVALAIWRRDRTWSSSCQGVVQSSIILEYLILVLVVQKLDTRYALLPLFKDTTLYPLKPRFINT